MSEGLIIAALGFGAAVVGLIAAVVGRRKEVVTRQEHVHRHETINPDSPKGPRFVCPHCGGTTFKKVWSVEGVVSTLILIVLLFLWVVPGLIYFFLAKQIVLVCKECKTRMLPREARA